MTNLMIKETFSKFKEPLLFSRVDSSHHIDWFFGLNEEGKKTVKLRATFTPKRFKETGAIKISHFKGSKFNTLQFTLENDSFANMYFWLISDFVNSTRSIESNEVYAFIHERFNKWRLMFLQKNINILSEIKMTGLIGEIKFLTSYMFEKYGVAKSIYSWSSSDQTSKDFSIENTWYEVKTTGGNGLTVKISSLEQLDSEVDGELVVVHVEKRSPEFNGITLNKLILETIESIDDYELANLFIAKITDLGYTFNEIYDQTVYSFKTMKRYIVNNDFPRLTRHIISPSIARVEYDIVLANLNDYLIEEENND